MFSPIRGLLFDPARVESVGSATCPPYDVIDEAARQRYLASSPHNIVRLLLAEPGVADYTESARLLAAWQESGILARDPSPRLYRYDMDHDGPSGRITARGVLGALAVEELGNRVIAHEETLPKTSADRYTLLETTRANLDVITVLTPSSDFGKLLADAPASLRLDFEADGIRHRLFDITDDDAVDGLCCSVAAGPFFIADGHHRYGTALRYRTAMSGHGTGPWDGILTFLAPTVGSGLDIAAAHRVFPSARLEPTALDEAFVVEPSEPRPPSSPGDLVLVGPAGSVHARPRDAVLAGLAPELRRASAAVARDLLYPIMGVTAADAEYVADPREAVRRAGSGIAVLTHPITEEDVEAAGVAGVRFPQKTTYFRPKARSGLVVRLL